MSLLLSPNKRSAAAVGRIAIGRQEQRDMIVPSRIGEAEAYRDDIEKGRIAPRRPLSAVIVAGVEAQLIRSGFQGLPFEYRRIGSPVFVGGHRLEKPARSIDRPQLNDETRSRKAEGCVEHMRRQPSHVSPEWLFPQV